MDIQNQLRVYEGTKSYQAKMGYFKNDKFYPYQDSLGYWTIGYGRLIQGSQDKYKNGITEAEAEAFLSQDIETAKNDVKSLGIGLPESSNWNDFMVLMVFQLGITKTRQFKKFLAALKTKNYATAIIEVKNSNWYKQTPNRVDSMLNQVING